MTDQACGTQETLPQLRSSAIPLDSVWRTGHQHAGGVEKSLARDDGRPETFRARQDKHYFGGVLHHIVGIVFFSEITTARFKLKPAALTASVAVLTA